jgi:hypothetical protein
VDQVVAAMSALGLPPAQAASGIVLAVLLRYARGMFSHITSEATYIAALAFGVLGALLDSTGADWKPVVREALALTALVLVLQKVLETAAKQVPWLPQDSEWVKK